MRPTRCALMVVALLIASSLALAGVPQGHAFAALDFGQARAQTACFGQPPCFDEAFEDVGDNTAWASCFDSVPNIPACLSDSRGGQRWDLDVFNGFLYPGGGDIFPVQNGISVEATLTGDELTLTGEAHFDYPPIGLVQFALLHYTGDPRDLEGVVVDGLQDLLEQGIVTQGQVLYSSTYTEQTDIDMTVDVSGIPASQIVIYGYGVGPAPPNSVPASSNTATLVLIAALMVATGVLARRS